MLFFLILIFTGIIDPSLAQSSNDSLRPTVVSIPGGEGGIGFDDLVYSSDLHKVLVPTGHTGKLYLIDPVSFAMIRINGFSTSAIFQKGQRIGVTSADEGEGYIFAADRGRHELDVVDLNSGLVVASSDLAGISDYVRYVGFNHEIWVTEPHNKQIEVFVFDIGDKPMIRPILLIPFSDGPEALVVDHALGHAYTNVAHEAVAIDIDSHTIIGTWPNECGKSRGDAIDEQKGFLFVSCAEGRAVVFDLNQDNKEISNLSTDPGPDVISYNPKLSHLYVTSSQNATLSVLGVSAQGKLSLLNKVPADKRAHCVVSDDQNNIWVCDPPRGQLLRYKDSL
jgi:DNA-binding beta-propeller fold protein YncE